MRYLLALSFFVLIECQSGVELYRQIKKIIASRQISKQDASTNQSTSVTKLEISNVPPNSKEIMKVLADIKTAVFVENIKIICDQLMIFENLFDELVDAKKKGNRNRIKILSKRFNHYVFKGANTVKPLMDVLDELDAKYHTEGSRLFDKFIGVMDEQSNSDTIQQSQMWKLQQFLSKLSKAQASGYNMFIFAVKEGIRKPAKVKKISDDLRDLWIYRANRQAERAKQLSSRSDSLFKSNLVTGQSIRVKKICFKTPVCKSHFFKMIPVQKNTFEVYDALEIVCYETLDRETTQKGEKCESFPGGSGGFRKASTKSLMVPELTTQYICQLSIDEDTLFKTPILHVKAAVCDKQNHTFVQNIYSSFDEDTMILVSWPYEIVQYQMPNKIGYVVGVQFHSLDGEHLSLRFHTSYHETDDIKTLKDY